MASQPGNPLTFNDVTRAINDHTEIYGIWFGTIFVWPDPWTDTWAEGTSVYWENLWRNMWSATSSSTATEATDGNQ